MEKHPHAGRAVGLYCQPGGSYSRLYLNAKGDCYRGICYKCATRLRVAAGPGGVDVKQIEITCPRPPLAS